MSVQATVAIASDFLTCLTEISKREQTKIIEFINRFRADPSSKGINLEPINGAKDPDLRSIRINDNFRGIVKKPEHGNVYLLLWVDTHEKAYAWGMRKKCSINAETGSIQVYDVVWDKENNTDENNRAVVLSEAEGIFASYSNRNLIKIGVPEEQVPFVKKIKTEEELEQFADKLPQEANEALFFLLNGYSIEEILANVEITADPKVDTNDFAVALSNLDSKRRFVVVDDDSELQAILNAPLEKWRVFLHPTQRKLVEQNWNGPVRVLGGAGTGKTVVAIHRAKFLAEHVYTSSKDRIFFTTFTRNLAEDIKDHLKRICSVDALARIEVINLDRWAFGFLKQNGVTTTLTMDGDESSYWKQALALAPTELNFPEEFYREEWESIIQPQEIETLEQYIKALRLGRGTRVDRKSRIAIWTVFEEYRLLLKAADKKEPVDAMRDARKLIESNNLSLGYSAILVDEAQDMSAQAFRLLRAMAGPEHGNDLFIVGDAHQRIYRYKTTLSKCGINIRGRSRTLKINYRTTDEIRKWAVRLLKGVAVDDLDGGVDDQKGYKALLHGHAPEVKLLASAEDEIQYIVQYFHKIGKEQWRDSCIVARTKKILGWYKEKLQSAGIAVSPIETDKTDDRSAEGVRLATMHRVKGLEFDRMLIASVNDSVIPWPFKQIDSADAVVRNEYEARERALLYVAATRAKKEVVITAYGNPSPFLR